MSINPAGLVEVAIAIYIYLLASGTIKASKNAQKQTEWLGKYRSLLNVAATVILLLGLASTFRLMR
jgi:hypothetical protein